MNKQVLIVEFAGKLQRDAVKLIEADLEQRIGIPVVLLTEGMKSRIEYVSDGKPDLRDASNA